MAEDVLWRFGHALRAAINTRSVEALSPLIADDVDWSVFGPVDMFPFLGQRRGKAAVLDVCRQAADHITVKQCERESAIFDAKGSGALILRFTVATTEDAARSISLRLANFARFENGLLAQLRVVIDSFDLVEQTLGREIHLPRFA